MTQTVGACPFDREHASARRVLLDEPQRLRVTVVVREHRRLDDDRAVGDLHDRERVRVAVRIDTHHVVQLICKHPFSDLQPKRWGTQRCRSGWKPQATEL